ncbi:MAG: pepA [Planctomycetaceae bacterium]|nr:pepA [Planctomycetaceae bacterium]
MAWQLDAAPWTSADADWLIIGIPESCDLSGPIANLDTALGGQLTRLKEAGDLTGKLSELVPLRGVQGLDKVSRILIVGLGKPEQQTEAGLHKAFVTAVRQISSKEKQRVAVAIPQVANLTPETAVQVIAAATQIGGQGQDLYRTERQRYPLSNVQLLIQPSDNLNLLKDAAAAGIIIGEAVNLTRELVNQPPSVIFPISFAARAEKVAQDCGLKCEIFDENWLKKERMNAFLAVSQGSVQPPRMVVLEYNNAPADAPVLTLVGKGVTFDSGGLSLKPTDGMLTMKCDMAGAATVLGTMQAIARLKLPIHIRGMMGLTENMPSGSAFKLGDVMHARNGVTIENQNTDAEGRLVLADVLSYAVDCGTDGLIDLATLTGACVVALGEEVVGAFSNHQGWCDQLLAASKRSGEDTWQMPMWDHFNELNKSEVADIRNTGGRWGGAITAAKFLEKFVGGRPWVHLDIAGPAFASSNKPYREGGGTGVMVKTLVELARGFARP